MTSVISDNINDNSLAGKLFFSDSAEQRPAVIVLRGSNGGINELAAQSFAEEGFVALALAYFQYSGVPENLENIPLEYFLRAIQWLRSQPNVQGEVRLYGASRGGELVLLLGSLFPEEIASIAAIVPSCVTYGGVPHAKKPAWTLDEKPFPVAPFPIEGVIKQLAEQQTLSYAPLFLRAMQKNPEGFDEASIKVENIRCPLLLISGKDDRMWPSWLYADLVMERLNRYDSSISRTHLCYPDVGHMITNPAAPL